jgi:molybdopterin biosynthesis enzyme
LALRSGGIVASAARLIANDIARHGGAPKLHDTNGDLADVLAAQDFQAIVAIGGTGSGRNDASAHTLARAGRLAVHGLALTPGETGALGFVGAGPVLLLPGRLDAALAVWLVIGRRMLERLGKAAAHESGTTTLPLARKVTSTVGLAEVVPVRRNGDKAEPLASKYLPLSALSRSDGWILVPADSEGYAAGTPVEVKPWP